MYPRRLHSCPFDSFSEKATRELKLNGLVCKTKHVTLSISVLDRSVQGRKAHTGYTALIKAPTHEIEKTEPRPDHNTGNSIPYSFR